MSNNPLHDTLEALQFAEGAILDAIAHDDGLDGRAGLGTLEIIWAELDRHEWPRVTAADAEQWCRKQYADRPGGTGYGKPVGRDTAELRAEIERLRTVIQFTLDKCVCRSAGNQYSPFAYLWKDDWNELERLANHVGITADPDSLGVRDKHAD